MPGIFDTVVDANVQALLRREQRLLVELRETLEREQVDERRRVDELLATLEDLFTIVIVGEFNAGKSSLINALFGEKLRVEGPIPVDDVISILRYGEEASQRRLSDFVVEQFYPIELLRNITLVDTPGTNSIVQRHQEITEDYIPRADLVLFVTSIDRPLSESERKFLEYIREWGKKVVFVLNKIDTKTDEEIAQVVEYLKTNVRAIFGFDAVILPISTKTLARFDALEDYIFRVLSEKERIRIKLTAPLETILSLSKMQFRMIDSRRELLATDKARIDAITDQLERARADLVGNFSQFVVRIDNLLMDLERRGLDFLDRYVRIQHVMMLRDASRFREEFERQVFQGWKGNIDSTIQEAVDWLVKENMKLWNGTVDAFHRRAEADAKHDDVIGRVGREFAYNREEVYSRMRRDAEQRLSAYDVNVESRRIIDNAMRAVLHSFGLGVGALGLGYLLTTAVSSTAVDVTGLTAATMLLVTSFLILPYKRTKAKEEFKRRIEEMRVQLQESLDRESVTEIDRMLRGITSAFEPYQRFYASESEKVERFAEKLTKIEAEANEILRNAGVPPAGPAASSPPS
ncbi:MAG TPA: dynamin family protein [Thermoanaerobaculia bacterium]|jgi:small GTP-binding protein|nr:dynamin family protein [Thermoanaerobaculia bacterium]